MELLAPKPGDVVFDGTVGLGGHASALIPLISPGGKYIGVDLDEEMLRPAEERLATSTACELHLYCGNYADLPEWLEQAGVDQADSMLLDLGLNSAQLDDPMRGFSFDNDGPLDMRFSRDQKEQALDLVNRLDDRELADLFYQFGQEGNSRRIARRICQVRRTGRIRTTKVLAGAVESAFMGGKSAARGKINPATRVFQALRVAVNREFENLERFLVQAPRYLRIGGKMAVISFHSLEDGKVKSFLRDANNAPAMREITKRPVTAAPAERRRNPRSRSAKLRVAERLAP